MIRAMQENTFKKLRQEAREKELKRKTKNFRKK
jgi:hypothetical protein